MKPIDVERYLADNASAEVRARIEATMAANAEFAERIRRRRAERRAFAVDPRRRRFSDLVREAEAEKTSLTRRSEVSTRRWAMAAVLASGAAVGLAIAPLSTDVPARVGDASMRTKGGTSVRLAVARVDGTVAAYAPGDTLHPGDRIRISVRAVAEGFVSVLLEEREGDVQVIYGAAELGRLPAGRHELPGSLRLDDRLGWERLYIAFSPRPADELAWKRQIESAQRSAGFDHGWLPAAPVWVRTVDYRKVKR